MLSHTSHRTGTSNLTISTLSALGIVYGDIGTSPLYAIRECFHGPHGLSLSAVNVFGILSLIFWALIIVISIKYLLFVMRADNKGEGGILALMSLASPQRKFRGKKKLGSVIIFGLFGAALLYGDGIITPAISVLSAIEGLKIATPLFEPYVLPITIFILTALFLVQKNGTAIIGKAFGPIILLWFTTLGILGVYGIISEPKVLQAVNPIYAFNFFMENQWRGFVALGSVFLVVTGGEALYADMGHFGIKPIKAGWFFVVLPALLLQYFGQGALILQNPEAVTNPFYLLAPSWALYPLVALATMATVIASQAMLTGAFSLSQQAIQLGYLPRISIKHTSAQEIGQIYVPFVNWVLFAGTIFLVLEFGTSSNLAAAYGIAVTSTMVITTILTYVVMRNRWKWSSLVVLPLVALFLSIDLLFFGANALKILDGGWVPLLIGILIFILMTTWKRGRVILAERLSEISPSLEQFHKESASTIKTRVPGIAVFMTANLRGAPAALTQNVKHNQILHQKVVIITLVTENTPIIADDKRVEINCIGEDFYRVVASYGFMERPNVPELLKLCGKKGLEIEIKESIFFLGRETLIASSRPGMAIWREKLFALMSRNAQRATDYFQIPSDQVIEIGTVVEM